MTTPDWLKERGGALKLGGDGQRWFVVFSGQPNYSLAVVPVDGKLGCAIRQTINGQRIDCASGFATNDEAIKGGLDALRKSLGWG